MARKKRERIAVLDAETDPFKFNREPKPFAWGLMWDGFYKEFWGEDCTDQLLEFLQDESDLLIYIHNGGKFDVHFFIKHLDENVKMIGPRIAECSLFGGRVKIRDSYCIIPLPLSAGDKGEIDYDIMESEKRYIPKNKKLISEYLRQDCVALLNWVNRFREEFGNSLTLGGCTFKLLPSFDYEVQKTFDEKYDSQMRDFFYGGRVQAFKVGAFGPDAALKYYDIQSAYPFGMVHDHWYDYSFVTSSTLPEGENGSWFAVIEGVSKGALPFRGKNKTYYPDDDVIRRYNACGWEINTALELGLLEITSVIKVFKPLFKKSLKTFIEHYYTKKLQAEIDGDRDTRTFAKLAMNVPYGKLAQDARKFKDYRITEPGQRVEGGGWELEEMTPHLWIHSRPSPQTTFFNVATSASITSFVRAYLLKAIHSSENVLYCDTDSIICSKFGARVGKNLGDWDCEEPRVIEAYIACRKMYAIKSIKSFSWPSLLKRVPKTKTKTASKGVRLSFDEIKNGVKYGGQIEWRSIAPNFNIKREVKFSERVIDFSDIEKNTCTTPDIL